MTLNYRPCKSLLLYRFSFDVIVRLSLNDFVLIQLSIIYCQISNLIDFVDVLVLDRIGVVPGIAGEVVDSTEEVVDIVEEVVDSAGEVVDMVVRVGVVVFEVVVFLFAFFSAST